MQATKSDKSIRKKLQLEKELTSRYLCENMLDGFAYCKMIFDPQGKPVDFIYLQINDALSKLVGIKKSALLGKKVTEVIPGIKQEHPII